MLGIQFRQKNITLWSKFCVMIMLILMYGINAHGQITIVSATTTISGSSVCPGTSVTVNYTSTGTITSTDILMLQISNSSGSFSSPTTLTSLAAGANPGSISGMLSNMLITGTSYTLRVISTETSSSANTGTFTVLNRTLIATYPGLLTNYNVDDIISANYTTNCDFLAGNNFILELSDKNGSFTSAGYPKAITTLSSITGTNTAISGMIPSVPGGNGYRIRVRSTNPALTSAISDPFTINYIIENVSCICNNDNTPI